MNTNLIFQLWNITNNIDSIILSGNYVRLNSSDVGLDIRAGILFLDLEYECIIVVGDTSPIEKYGEFDSIDKNHILKVESNNTKVTVYTEQSDKVQQCFNVYYNEYLPDLEKEEQIAKDEGL